MANQHERQPGAWMPESGLRTSQGPGQLSPAALVKIGFPCKTAGYPAADSPHPPGLRTTVAVSIRRTVTEAMAAALVRPVDPLRSKERAQPAIFAINWEFKQTTLRIGLANIAFIDLLWNQHVMGSAIIEVHQTAPSVMFVDRGVNQDVIIEQGPNHVRGRAHRPVRSAKNIAAVIRINRPQQRFQELLTNSDDLVESVGAQTGEIVFAPVLSPAPSLISCIEI